MKFSNVHVNRSQLSVLTMIRWQKFHEIANSSFTDTKEKEYYEEQLTDRQKLSVAIAFCYAYSI